MIWRCIVHMIKWSLSWLYSSVVTCNVRLHWCIVYLGFAGRKKRYRWTVRYKNPQEGRCIARWRCRMHNGREARSCLGQQTTIPCRVILQLSDTGLIDRVYLLTSSSDTHAAVATKLTRGRLEIGVYIRFSYGYWSYESGI